MTYRARCTGRRGNSRRKPKPTVTAGDLQNILKEMYPATATPCHSPCILDAYRRNWITREVLAKIPKWDMRPGIYDFAYAKSPLFSMFGGAA